VGHNKKHRVVNLSAVSLLILEVGLEYEEHKPERCVSRQGLITINSSVTLMIERVVGLAGSEIDEDSIDGLTA
jgi:hypothetical protein